MMDIKINCAESFTHNKDYSEFNCTIPDCFEIKVNEFGDFGTYFTQDFKKGEIIYKNRALLLDYDIIPDKIKLHTNKGEFFLDKLLHLSDANEKSFVYNWDSYFNHHCDPNTIHYFPFQDDPEIFVVETIKDVKKGDEVTCNYLFFCYKLNKNEEPFNCRCGSENCFGKISSFSDLTKEQQKKIFVKIEQINNFEKYYGFDKSSLVD